MADKNAVKDLSKALKAVDSIDESGKQTTKESTSTGENALTSNETTSPGSFRTELERLFPNVYGTNKKRPSSAPDPQINYRNKKRKTSSKKRKRLLLESSSV